MPNAGIHGYRSTNWNSEEAPSKRAQTTTVTANVATATASVSHRITPLRRPSAFPMSSTASAPTTGNNQESVRSIATPNSQRPTPKSQLRELTASSPQVKAQNDNDPDEHRAGIRAHRTGLQTAQH